MAYRIGWHAVNGRARVESPESRVQSQGSRVEGQGSREKSAGKRSNRASASPSTVYRLPSTSPRSGISLLEVLISIFVLSIGLFGLAALIPVGSYQVAQMNKLDRGGTLGRQAFREAEIRGFLQPEMWLFRDGSSVKYDPFASAEVSFTVQPIMIDPLALDRADLVGSTTPQVETFPYHVDQAANAALSAPFPLQMSRIRLARPDQAKAFSQGLLSGPPEAMSPELAERIFRGGDDLIFARPDDAALRPQQMFLRESNTQPNSPALERQYDGNYSWLMTIAPAVSEEWEQRGNGQTGRFIGDRRLFTVSVVVFYRRKLPLLDPMLDPSTPATERMVLAEIEGNGLGGGSVHLEAENAVNLRNLRPNGWLLLCGRRLENTVPTGADRRVFRWYRIVSVDDDEGLKLDPPHRDVMVAGADWESFDTAGNPIFEDPAYAILVDDVVGVYEKTIAINRSQ